ncbi:MAG: hypothetical protein ABSE49_32015 [Polyangiaceae bacterium]|jgi:DNA-directed RNA polymerase specialized sigma24 family protein
MTMNNDIDTKQADATDATETPRPVNDNARDCARNDNAHPAGPVDTTILANHYTFFAAVRGTLIREGRLGPYEDDVREVQVRAIAAARIGPMPPDLPRWKALGRTIAKRYAIDERRKWKVRVKYDTGLCEEPDAHGPIEAERERDPVDKERYLAILKDLFDRGEMPEMGGEILWGAAEDVPQEETAEETGLTVRQVKQRLKQMRVRFRRRLEELGLHDE